MLIIISSQLHVVEYQHMHFFIVTFGNHNIITINFLGITHVNVIREELHACSTTAYCGSATQLRENSTN